MTNDRHESINHKVVLVGMNIDLHGDALNVGLNFGLNIDKQIIIKILLINILLMIILMNISFITLIIREIIGVGKSLKTTT
jgi:hypothetical protein